MLLYLAPSKHCWCREILFSIWRHDSLSLGRFPRRLISFTFRSFNSHYYVFPRIAFIHDRGRKSVVSMVHAPQALSKLGDKLGSLADEFGASRVNTVCEFTLQIEALHCNGGACERNRTFRSYVRRFRFATRLFVWCSRWLFVALRMKSSS